MPNALDQLPSQEPGSPQPFYERYGFVPTDRFVEEERVMRLDLKEAR